MRRWVSPLLLVAIVFLLWPNSSPAPIIYRPGEGWSYESRGAMGKWRRDRAKAQLDVAKEAAAKEDWRTVHKAAKRIVHEWPLSDYAPEAQQLLAQSYEARGDDERAFKEYQKLLRYYPQNVDYEEVQKRQMLIADRFLGGQRFKLWGKIPLYRSWKKSAQMYQEVVNVGPQSEVAPMAQMKAGEAWEKRADGFHVSERERHKDFGRAVEAYKKAYEEYQSDDTVAAEALYKKGTSYENQSKDAEYDQEVTMEAINAYEDMLALYPGTPKAEDASQRIAKMKTEQARGSITIAKFYEKKKKWHGAKVYYDRAIDLAPDSEHGQRAKERLAVIAKYIDETDAAQTE